MLSIHKPFSYNTNIVTKANRRFCLVERYRIPCGKSSIEDVEDMRITYGCNMSESLTIHILKQGMTNFRKIFYKRIRVYKKDVLIVLCNANDLQTLSHS